MGAADDRVLDAFGLSGSQIPLAGGEGNSVRVDNAVLKPAGGDVEATNWTATLMDSVVEDGFRVARPLRTRDGAWSFEGWTASTYLPGSEPDHVNAPRWLNVLRRVARSTKRSPTWPVQPSWPTD